MFGFCLGDRGQSTGSWQHDKTGYLAIGVGVLPLMSSFGSELDEVESVPGVQEGDGGHRLETGGAGHVIHKKFRSD